ncbi:hypothetical protein Zm00014a_029950 [Zea mays]|jgi:hypothetical protein|uniref:Uncharacterized protein n=1 Tax=Zea mays TaxID=4577 RepID=A0A3L6EX84_MAIZE|nr:hypothetical protein Zm00014a_029950 [Zea mays]
MPSSCVGETGLVAMDCLVVCCCCPCLVLQVTVFLFVRLPRKVVVKTKRVILRRWHRRRPPAPSSAAGLKLSALLDLDDDGFEAAFGMGEQEGASDWKERCRCFAVGGDGGVDVDVDGVWEAIIEQEGLFWFGSFWGRRGEGDDRMDGSFRLPVALERVRE